MRRWSILGVAAVAALLVQAASMGDLGPYVISGLLVLVNVAAALWSLRKRGRVRAGAAGAVAPLTVCWLVVVLLPTHNFATRSSASAVSSVSIQPLLEVMATVAVGLIALAAIRALEPSLTKTRPPLYLMVVPIWIMATSAWSEVALYSFVRGGQLFVIGLLAWATVAIGRYDSDALSDLVEAFLRWFLWITLALCALGVAFGGRFVAIAPSNRSRFTWVGAHPTQSGVIIAAALVIAVASPGRVLKMPPVVQLGAVGALAAAMFFNHSRAAWIGLAVALTVALALRGAVSWVVRRIGVPITLAAVVAAVYYNGSGIWEYMLRNRDSESFATGNGRRELWGIGFRAMENIFDWTFGLGFGITRTLFLPEAPWAGEAHSSILAMLVSTGVVGTIIWFASLGRTGIDLLRARMWRAGATGAALASLLVLVVVYGVTSDLLAEPTLGFSAWYLIAAVALARLQSPEAATPPNPHATAGHERPTRRVGSLAAPRWPQASDASSPATGVGVRSGS